APGVGRPRAAAGPEARPSDGALHAQPRAPRSARPVHGHRHPLGTVPGDRDPRSLQLVRRGRPPGQPPRDPLPPARPRPPIRYSVVTAPGPAAALRPPPRSNIHRMANAVRGCTVTIHTYGDPGTKATVFDIKAGTYESVELKFHNLQEP